MKNCLQLNLVFLGFLVNSALLGDLKAQSPGSQPDPSLMLHLDFDEDFSIGKVPDVTGNGHDAIQFNSTNNLTQADGVFGTKAGQWTYRFNQGDYSGHIYPASQYLAVTNVSGIQYLTNATISLWAKIDANTDFQMEILSAGYAPIYASGGAAQATNGWFLGRDITPNLCFVVNPASGGQLLVYWPDDTVRSGGSIPDLSTTRFHVYSITIDCPNNLVVAYYDGLPWMTNSIGLPWLRIYGTRDLPWLAIGTATMDGTPQWGDDLYPNSMYFVGKMDDIRIYNRTLSATEVQALYQGSTYAQNLAIQKAAPQSVQVRWDAKSNAVYQVEYRSNLTGTAWSPLQSAIPGSVTNSIIDSILGQPSRFYRVRVLP